MPSPFAGFPKGAINILNEAHQQKKPWIGTKDSVMAQLREWERNTRVKLPPVTGAHKAYWTQKGGPRGVDDSDRKPLPAPKPAPKRDWLGAAERGIKTVATGLYQQGADVANAITAGGAEQALRQADTYNRATGRKAKPMLTDATRHNLEAKMVKGQRPAAEAIIGLHPLGAAALGIKGLRESLATRKPGESLSDWAYRAPEAVLGAALSGIAIAGPALHIAHGQLKAKGLTRQAAMMDEAIRLREKTHGDIEAAKLDAFDAGKQGRQIERKYDTMANVDRERLKPKSNPQEAARATNQINQLAKNAKATPKALPSGSTATPAGGSVTPGMSVKVNGRWGTAIGGDPAQNIVRVDFGNGEVRPVHSDLIEQQILRTPQGDVVKHSQPIRTQSPEKLPQSARPAPTPKSTPTQASGTGIMANVPQIPETPIRPVKPTLAQPEVPAAPAGPRLSGGMDHTTLSDGDLQKLLTNTINQAQTTKSAAKIEALANDIDLLHAETAKRRNARAAARPAPAPAPKPVAPVTPTQPGGTAALADVAPQLAPNVAPVQETAQVKPFASKQDVVPEAAPTPAIQPENGLASKQETPTTTLSDGVDHTALSDADLAKTLGAKINQAGSLTNDAQIETVANDIDAIHAEQQRRLALKSPAPTPAPALPTTPDAAKLGALPNDILQQIGLGRTEPPPPIAPTPDPGVQPPDLNTATLDLAPPSSSEVGSDYISHNTPTPDFLSPGHVGSDKEPWRMTKAEFEEEIPHHASTESAVQSILNEGFKFNKRVGAITPGEIRGMFVGKKSMVEDRYGSHSFAVVPKPEARLLRGEEQKLISSQYGHLNGPDFTAALNSLGYDFVQGGKNSGQWIHPEKATFYPNHRAVVEEALREGKPVPPEVLADYPDLAPSVVPSPEPPVSASTPEPSILPEPQLSTRTPQVDNPPPVEGITPASDVYDVPTNLLVPDPERFQYKADAANKAGVTRKYDMRNTPYSRDAAGTIMAWVDPETNVIHPVNGHHRTEWARLWQDRKPEARTMRTIFSNAPNATEARAEGALQNIREGQGTATDAAKYFRDTGLTPDDLRAKGVDLKSGLANDGVAMSTLPDDLWYHLTTTGELPEKRAVAIAKTGLSPEQQSAMYQMIRRQEAKGKRVTEKDIENLVPEIEESPVILKPTKTKDGQIEGGWVGDMGGDEAYQSLAMEKAQLSTWLQGRIVKMKSLYKQIAEESSATDLSEQGNILDKEANDARAKLLKDVDEVYANLRRFRGPISQLLDDAAQKIGAGENANNVRQDLFRQTEQTIREAIAGGQGKTAPVGPGAREGGTPAIAGQPEPGAGGMAQEAGGTYGTGADEEVRPPTEAERLAAGQASLFGEPDVAPTAETVPAQAEAVTPPAPQGESFTDYLARHKAEVQRDYPDVTDQEYAESYNTGDLFQQYFNDAYNRAQRGEKLTAPELDSIYEHSPLAFNKISHDWDRSIPEGYVNPEARATQAANPIWQDAPVSAPPEAAPASLFGDDTPEQRPVAAPADILSRVDSGETIALRYKGTDNAPLEATIRAGIDNGGVKGYRLQKGGRDVFLPKANAEDQLGSLPELEVATPEKAAQASPFVDQAATQTGLFGEEPAAQEASPQAAVNPEIERLRQANREILATPMPSEVGPAQTARMSPKAHQAWMDRVAKRQEVEAQIRELSKSPETLANEQKAADLKDAQQRLAQIDSHSKLISETGIGKTGKLRPTVQRELDMLTQERQQIVEAHPELAGSEPSAPTETPVTDPNAPVAPDVPVDRAAELRQRSQEVRDRMLKRTGKISSTPLEFGVLGDLVELGAIHIELGARDFAAWSKSFLADLQQSFPDLIADIQPHLPKIYSRALEDLHDAAGTPQEKATWANLLQQGKGDATPQTSDLGAGTVGASWTPEVLLRKLNLDPSGQRRVFDILDQANVTRSKVSLADMDQQARLLADDLRITPNDPHFKIDKKKLQRFTGPELLARRMVVKENVEVINELAKRVNDDTVPEAERQQAFDLIGKLDEQNNGLLGEFVTGAAEAGRNLVALRNTARMAEDPTTLLIQAKRALGDAPLTDAIRADITRLFNAMKEAC